ncbi:hypothetical protein [Methylocystis sp. SC2]|uniref:hypothetical protein n=1 Tax=Methylocystis sp. (strain SC2) TaxID=187303 RepID=UPI00027AE8AC|nr:hypothetical protein [Methylocystis sp. SC2]CCJ08536.1 Hypothetical protein BN69_3085 [Methylocystis sp. SC2]
MRPFNKRLRRSSSAAGGRLRLGALLFSAMLVGSAAPAGAAEIYRGDDPDSYECSSDYQILNRFSAPPGVSLGSTKYADIKFALKNNVISVKDASNSKNLAYISVDENTKYCAFKDVQVFEEKKLWRKECNTKYHAFRLRIIVDQQLPVTPFGFPGRLPAEIQQPFDKMNHFIDVNIYRTADGRKKYLSARCTDASGTPEVSYRLRYLDQIATGNKSAVSISEVAPSYLREAGSYTKYEREALKKAGPGVPRPK